MSKGRKLLIIAPLAFTGILLFIVIGGAIVQALWNWLLPPLFGWPEVGFWQALGLLALCRILFGGLGLHARHRSHLHEHLTGRWAGMSPEERERLRATMRVRFGLGPEPGEGKQP